MASSHREAPFITENPKVDGTDFYMFRSYETGRDGFVTFIANYQPLQAAYGGPNYFPLDPDAIYEIHVDNTGDAIEDVTFQFDFDQALKGGRGLELDVGKTGATKKVAIPLTIAGPISAGHEEARQQDETYGLTVIRGPRRTGTKSAVTHGGSATFGVPLDYIGQKTFADYEGYSKSFIYDIDIPGCTPPDGTHARVFVGQRRETFAVNLGEIFDLVNARIDDNGPSFNAIGAEDQGKNQIGDAAVTSIAIEVPISCVKGTGDAIGAWTTASLRQARVLNPTATFEDPTREGGPWVQVSRLGMPLVNEVVIGLPDKDRFNGSEPKDDLQFLNYVDYPTLPELLEILFPGILTAPNLNDPTNGFIRTDLRVAFLTGVAGINATGSTAEMLRLDLALPAIPLANQNSLGAALCFVGGVLTPGNPGCDVGGFPNGRRPYDDVVDVALRVAMGYLLPTTVAPNAETPLVDGAMIDKAILPATFPYLPAPLPGSPGGN
ncbi:MAG: DUF4331 domain-containing protein [Myxococcota bacterium]